MKLSLLPIDQLLHGLQLQASGKKEQIEAELARKLTECGWRDDVKAKCCEIIAHRGRDNITTDELVALVAPAGRASVPDALKAGMLGTMKEFVQSLDL
jgi:enhancer of yellow 2 transcription factor